MLEHVDLNIAPWPYCWAYWSQWSWQNYLIKRYFRAHPIEGELRVLGHNPYSQRTELLENVSFIADTAILPRWLKVAEAITYVEGVHQI